MFPSGRILDWEAPGRVGGVHMNADTFTALLSKRGPGQHLHQRMRNPFHTSAVAFQVCEISELSFHLQIQEQERNTGQPWSCSSQPAALTVEVAMPSSPTRKPAVALLPASTETTHGPSTLHTHVHMHTHANTLVLCLLLVR